MPLIYNKETGPYIISWHLALPNVAKFYLGTWFYSLNARKQIQKKSRLRGIA